jgi:bifunctional non-homologous end joining protein LigD
MLPQVRGRPIMMQRFPSGIRAQPFVQQRAPDYFPGWVKRTTVRKRGSIIHAVMDNAATLGYLAELA